MSTINDQKLLRLIRFAPVVIIGVSALVLNIMLIKDNRDKAEHSIETLRSEVINQQKESIEQHVNLIFNEVNYQNTRAEKLLKQQAKSRVEEAYSIANSLYQTNQDKPDSEISRLISEALRPIRFFEGRGYFFIFTMNGINVMHGLRPHVEGKDLIESQDVRGSFILKEHIKLIKESGAAFYRWWYQKPNEPKDKEFEKIGYGKEFAPFNWFIGTGEYVVDVENDIKQQVLSWIQDYSYDDRGYIFVVDNDGVILSHRDPSYLGRNLTDFTDAEGMKMRSMIMSSKDEGSFVSYNLPITADSQLKEEKISYVRLIKQWGWTIGTGFYLQDFEKYLAEQEALLDEKNRADLIKVSLLSLLLTGIFTGLSLVASNIVAKRFDRFQFRINKDFNELDKTKNQMQHMAMHDALTGLPNRLHLLNDISKGMRLSKANNKLLAVVFVDLDDFKKVNDLYGHASGDKLLTVISRKFESLLGEHDTVSRFGGDEFIFCLPLLKDIKHAEYKVNKIKKTFSEQFVIDGKILSTNCSIGVSMYPTDSDDEESLIRKADIVLYKSKAVHKGMVLFYDNDINEQVKYDFILEDELRKAIEKDELFVLYQPQLDIRQQKLVSVEALARWSNERLGNVSPVKFIAIAEDTGLIHDIGLFVFRTACEDMMRYSANGENAIKVSINISPRQLLEDSFSEDLLKIISDVGIDIKRVNLEITENVLINDIEKVTPTLQMLRNLGFGISLDDFGTGYSSLSYLNNLPITEIKIDRCFVDKLLLSEQSNTLIRAIIAIGASNGMQVVAEGVETEDQYKELIAYGCSLVQGYYIDRPLPIEKLIEREGGQVSA